MFSPRIALAGALSSAAALAFTVALALPASASPTSPQCFQAEANVASQENVVEGFSNTLSNDTVKLQAAKDKLAQDQAAVPVVPDTIATDQTAVSNAQQTVNQDQASLRTAKANLATAIATRDSVCNNTPTPTPTPGPVGTPGGFPNCAAAFAAGVSNISSTDSRYRLYLDRDHDGVACELNGNDGGVVGDNVQYRIINGKKCHQVNGAWVPVTVTAPPPCTSCSAPPPVIYQAPQVVAPAPVFVAPAPVYSAPIAPSGPAATGR